MQQLNQIPRLCFGLVGGALKQITRQLLGIVYRVIAGHLIRQAGYTQQAARTGAVTLIQRFGSALNLNIHFYAVYG